MQNETFKMSYSYELKLIKYILHAYQSAYMVYEYVNYLVIYLQVFKGRL